MHKISQKSNETNKVKEITHNWQKHNTGHHETVIKVSTHEQNPGYFFGRNDT